MSDNNEDNILKAFQLGAKDILEQKRDPKDMIVFGGNGSKQQSGKEKIIINLGEDDDDDFAGNAPLYQNSNVKQNTYGQTNNLKDQINSMNSKVNYMNNNNNDSEDDDVNLKNIENTNNNAVNKQMFVDREDLGKNSGQVAKAAGIYLEKDEELEKLKQIYEGNKGNNTFTVQQKQKMTKKKQEKESKVTKLTKNDFKYDKDKKIKNIINDEEELGEIGEWIEATANKASKVQNGEFDSGSKNEDDDDDFNYDDVDAQKHNLKQEQKQDRFKNDDLIKEDDEEEQEDSGDISASQHQKNKKAEQEVMRQKQEIVNKKLQKQQILQIRGGPIANRLQDKAKFIELTHKDPQSDKQVQNELNENQSKDPKKQNQNNKQILVVLPEESARKSENEEEEKEDDINWDEINKRTIQEMNKNVNNSNNVKPATQQVGEKVILSQQKKEITFMDAWPQFKQMNLSEFKQNIVTDTRQNQNASLVDVLFGLCGFSQPNISTASLLEERDQIFSIAKMPFNDQDPLHFQILSSIFYFLKDNYNCPRTGSHWESIGFQGVNPATDLRGVGMLGLLQILALTSYHLPLAKEALEYSNGQVHNFPLAVTLINITNIVMQTSREQKLNSMINSEKSVVSTFNNFFFATFFFFFQEYKTKQMTFNILGQHLKTIETQVKLNPKKTVDDFKSQIQRYYKINEK